MHPLSVQLRKIAEQLDDSARNLRLESTMTLGDALAALSQSIPGRLTVRVELSGGIGHRTSHEFMIWDNETFHTGTSLAELVSTVRANWASRHHAIASEDVVAKAFPTSAVSSFPPMPALQNDPIDPVDMPF